VRKYQNNPSLQSGYNLWQQDVPYISQLCHQHDASPYTPIYNQLASHEVVDQQEPKYQYSQEPVTQPAWLVSNTHI
jgi:hypothetical protein